jgi:hypothetical protein
MSLGGALKLRKARRATYHRLSSLWMTRLTSQAVTTSGSLVKTSADSTVCGTFAEEGHEKPSRRR